MDYRKYLLENSATLQDCPLYWQVFRVYVAKALFLRGAGGGGGACSSGLRWTYKWARILSVHNGKHLIHESMSLEVPVGHDVTLMKTRAVLFLILQIPATGVGGVIALRCCHSVDSTLPRLWHRDWGTQDSKTCKPGLKACACTLSLSLSLSLCFFFLAFFFLLFFGGEGEGGAGFCSCRFVFFSFFFLFVFVSLFCFSFFFFFVSLSCLFV